MLDVKLLGKIRYVVDSQGRKAAVQLDLKAWNALLDYLEDLEDRSLIKEKIHQLQTGPDNSGAISWGEVKQDW